MGIVTAYRCGSGTSNRDACFLGDRYDEAVGIAREKSECWVLAVRPSPEPKPGQEFNLRYQRGNPGTYTGLWRAPGGAVWVSDADGLVHHNQDPWADDAGARWTTHSNFFHMRASGVWGLDDDNVFVWLDHRGTPVVRCWTGRPNWGHLGDMNSGTGPGFGFAIAALHGTAPDHLVAVGTGGRIVRWDGAKWTREECPVEDDLLSVFVVSADEAWATSAGGALLRFDGRWSVVVTHEKPLVAVAKWRGEVWTGGEGGLLRRDGDALQQVRAWQPLQIDARGELVVTTAAFVAGSADGAAFAGVAKGFLADMRADVGLLGDFEMPE